MQSGREPGVVSCRTLTHPHIPCVIHNPDPNAFVSIPKAVAYAFFQQQNIVMWSTIATAKPQDAFIVKAHLTRRHSKAYSQMITSAKFLLTKHHVFSVCHAYLFLSLFIAIPTLGEEVQKPRRSFHQNFNWRAEDYFIDPKVIELCAAIEKNDLENIEKLLKGGVKVNTLGKDNMTPLLWAFPDEKLERFELLLKHGADPNVHVESEFGTRGFLAPGLTVTHLACKTKFDGYFELVFKHGGNVNLILPGPRYEDSTPIFYVIREGNPEKRAERIDLLISLGADVNYINGYGKTPMMQAASWGPQFDLVIQMLKAGADPKKSKPDSNQRLIHSLAMRPPSDTWSSKQTQDYNTLVTLLGEKGESLETAKTDLARWKTWKVENGEYLRNMKHEAEAQNKFKSLNNKK